MKTIQIPLLPATLQLGRRNLFAIIATLSFTSSVSSQTTNSSRPNVLIIHVDEWRAQSTGYSGDKDVKTPNLDKLSATSANFVNAVSGIPVCTPFRASLVTGQRPLTNGIFMNDVRLDTNAITIAKVFDENGYQTGYIGKWHLDGKYRLSFTPPGARRQGFEYWKAVNCDHNYNHSVYYDNDDTTRHYWKGYDVFAEAKDAEKYLRNHAHDHNPFFLMLAFGPPHNPYNTAPEAYTKMYDPSKLALRPNVPVNMQNEVRENLVGYYSHMTAIDDMVGEIINTLKQEGVYDNTIILFTSDHGDLMGSHGAYRKQKPWDESIKVPMLFHYSGNNGIKEGNYSAMINSEDIMPTLLGMCNIKVPGTVEGIDFSKYLQGKEKDPKDTVSIITCIQPFGEWARVRGGKEYRGIRTPQYTYVRDLNGPWLLFDDANDPYQMKNLVNNPGYTLLQHHLDSLLAEKLKVANDKFLPGLFYVKKFHYPPLDATGTVGYYE
ncbi:sulfatase [Ginsengibacter hankyongi]|uniref:Sulfatase n=1 Tax=Ginsengibacter hankyongi TaxID=2607284 RepID=A0A5J5IBJ6_9BACT|nr:sulfatase [Ginsengibacter hankyongi]KAA9035642.1 sulfatase [Ginsengibacter hankyongi]